eukprot:TRINITY_DN405_c0_g1_i1.p1 TRINITY_DN405_c0_g1~~TRINITY_DN405_c0_g1_i1.p1  ORF type:complete len:217 (-),score=49.07 TRINITY_DN405_c0_g1_i1:180-770(-)
MSPLLYWEDPVQSGAVFIPVFTFLMAVQYNSLISVFAYAALLVLTIVGGCKAYVYVMVGLLKKLPDEPSSDPLHMVYEVNMNIPAENVVKVSNYATDVVNSGLTELKKLFFCENMIDTVKFGISLYCLTYIGSWFHFLTIIILAWTGIFTLPRVYLNNQAAIDDVVNTVKTNVDGMKEKVSALFPTKASEADKKEE